MKTSAVFFTSVFFFCLAAPLLAWDGAEHSMITSAALEVLPIVTAWIGVEARKWIKIYSNYPDFNWLCFGEIIRSGAGFKRSPDERHDWNASHYCDFDEATGKGDYYAHGTRLSAELSASDGKIPLVAGDEHCQRAFKHGRFSERAVVKFFKHSLDNLRTGNLRDGIRFAGVLSHYIEDNTPPPHFLVTDSATHHAMEQIKNKEKISIRGYVPQVLFSDDDQMETTLLRRMEELGRFAAAKAPVIRELVKLKKMDEAEDLTVVCADQSAMLLADCILTLYKLCEERWPSIPETSLGVNLLKNPSFDLDRQGQNLPDDWVREWYDLTALNYQHVWNRYTARSGKACVKLLQTPEKGACWRVPWANSVQGRAGQRYRLSGFVRPESASGENYLGVLCFNADMEMIGEIRSQSVAGSEAWRRLEVEATVPVQTTDILAGCFSNRNTGAVLFDDLELIRQIG
ncbi:MAG: hypothetical protein KKC28_08735 [Verrucomicrobia bacterium]|nr:hypothetical protein [Verrucomicrobiota bacterium]